MCKYQGYLVCIPIQEESETGLPPIPDNWTVQVRVIISSDSMSSDFCLSFPLSELQAVVDQFNPHKLQCPCLFQVP